MTYIRTDYHIFKVSRVLKNGTFLIKGRFHISKDYTLEQASTIEELCDEFVVVDVNSHWTYQTINYELKTLKESFVNNETIYGAIWTNQGLKYVAKMNSKGELELI